MPIAELYTNANGLNKNVASPYRTPYAAMRIMSAIAEEGISIRATQTIPDTQVAAAKAGTQLLIILAGCKPIAKDETDNVIVVSASWATPAAIEKHVHPPREAITRRGTRTSKYRSSTNMEYFGFPRLLYASAQTLLKTILIELVRKKSPK